MEYSIDDFWLRLEQVQLMAGRMTLQTLCENVQTPYQTVINQKCQHRYPSVSVLVKFAVALHVSLDWLLFGTEKPDSDRVQKLIDKIRSSSSEEISAIETLIMKHD